MAEIDVKAAVEALKTDPRRLQVLLEDAGWRLSGGRRHEYVRLSSATENGRMGENIVIPLDSTAPEFAEDLVAAFEATRQAVTPDFMARQLLPRLMIKNVDELDVRKA